MSPLCSRNARPKKALVGRAQWGTHPGHPGQRIRASLEGSSLLARCGHAWEKARPWAKRLSWQTQGGRVE
jgi:hypothetical protein